MATEKPFAQVGDYTWTAKLVDDFACETFVSIRNRMPKFQAGKMSETTTDERTAKLDRADRTIKILRDYPDMPLPEFISLHEPMQFVVAKVVKKREPRKAIGSHPLPSAPTDKKGK